MTTPPRPAALLLDLVGTILINKRWDPHAGLLRVLSHADSDGRVRPDEVFAAFADLTDGMTLRREEARFELPLRAVLRHLRHRFRLSFTITESELEWEFWRECTWHIPAVGVLDAISDAAHRELPVAVLSNNEFSGETLERELRLHGLAGCFRFVMSSADFVVRKPDPVLFLTAVGELGAKPDRVWYIGDNPAADVAGARAAGMPTVWYNPGGLPHCDPPPDLELRRWEDLAGLLAA